MTTKTKKPKATFDKELYERQQKNMIIIEAHKFRTKMAASKNYWDYMVKIMNNVESLCGYPAISRDTDYKTELLATFSDILHKTEWPEDPNKWKAIYITLSQGAMMQLRYLFDFMYISEGDETDEFWDSWGADPIVEVKGPIKHDWIGGLPTLLELMELGVVTLPQFCEQDGWNRGFKEYKLDKTIRYIIENNSLNLQMRQYYLMCLYFDKYRWNGEIISEMESLLINNNP